MSELIYVLDLAGTAVFASSGAIMAARLRMDPFGMMVLASLPAVGGGTLRDLILGVRPVFWVADPNYLFVIMATALATMMFVNHLNRIPEKLLLVLDALGLALFCIVGARKSLQFDTSWTIAVVMGVMTGVAGGMMRDIVCRQIPMILRKEIYATACIAGALVFIGLRRAMCRRLGGTTGDTAGAVLELLELTVVLSLALMPLAMK